MTEKNIKHLLELRPLGLRLVKLRLLKVERRRSEQKSQSSVARVHQASWKPELRAGGGDGGGGGG